MKFNSMQWMIMQFKQVIEGFLIAHIMPKHTKLCRSTDFMSFDLFYLIIKNNPVENLGFNSTATYLSVCPPNGLNIKLLSAPFLHTWLLSVLWILILGGINFTPCHFCKKSVSSFFELTDCPVFSHVVLWSYKFYTIST